MNDYPYNSAQIMSDTHFLAYGGETGTSTVAQRQAAYFIAEMQMTEHLGTLLVPTTVTGTYYQPSHQNPLQLDYGHVNSVIAVSVNSANGGCTDCTITNTTACAFVRNDTYGYIDVSYILGVCSCAYNYPYSIEVVYNAGFASGTALQPNMLLALTMAAQINVNEIDSHTLSNEGAFDIGVQRFSSQGYMEERTKLGHNAFGSSAVAQKIANLVKSNVHRPGLKFH